MLDNNSNPATLDISGVQSDTCNVELHGVQSDTCNNGETMNTTLVALLNSRKWWVGTMSVAAVFAAVLLRSLQLIPADALIPTIAAITTTGLGFIGSTAWENVSK